MGPDKMIKAKTIRHDAAVTRPTLCIKGCHLVVTMAQQNGPLGLEWACPTSRCGATYPHKYWTILKRTRRTG